MTTIGTDISAAAHWLMQGACVAIPTETVYGLAANALDPKTVARIFDVKNRPTFDPLIVHVPDLAAVDRYARECPAALRRLAEACWPGPLTLLLPKRANIPDLVTAGLPRVALRAPAHPATQALLHSLPFPLAAPSANPFGYISPTTARHVYDQLQGKIPYILDGGPCPVGVESTIVGEEDGQLVVYRLGGLALEAITGLVGPVQMRLNQSSNPAAPGMLTAHYAPRKPLVLIQPGQPVPQHRRQVGQKIGALVFQNRGQTWMQALPGSQIVVLSESGDLSEAAQRLFAALRQLDQADIDVIWAEACPEEGLGRAINDRLRRAAAH